MNPQVMIAFESYQLITISHTQQFRNNY